MTAIRIQVLTLKMRYQNQQRLALKCRKLANNARLNHKDQTAAMFDRSAEFAEMRAAALFAELLDLSEAYVAECKQSNPEP